MIPFCSILSFEEGGTLVLSATPWIIDSTTVQNILIIKIVSNITMQIQLQKSQTLQIHNGKHSDNEPSSSSCAIGRHVGI
jgi:hypothetical protein